ncbi:hypothetical protein [Kitasatospora griseola]|uniref:hypothetical protein n=1 Tax=Kitasatospora griseola TaxID=2064 RepID=UPI003830B01C
MSPSLPVPSSAESVPGRPRPGDVEMAVVAVLTCSGLRGWSAEQLAAVLTALAACVGPLVLSRRVG